MRMGIFHNPKREYHRAMGLDASWARKKENTYPDTSERKLKCISPKRTLTVLHWRNERILVHNIYSIRNRKNKKHIQKNWMFTLVGCIVNVMVYYDTGGNTNDLADKSDVCAPCSHHCT